jgi:hypothetical protein
MPPTVDGGEMTIDGCRIGIFVKSGLELAVSMMRLPRWISVRIHKYDMRAATNWQLCAYHPFLLCSRGEYSHRIYTNRTWTVNWFICSHYRYDGAVVWLVWPSRSFRFVLSYRFNSFYLLDFADQNFNIGGTIPTELGLLTALTFLDISTLSWGFEKHMDYIFKESRVLFFLHYVATFLTIPILALLVMNRFQ